MVLTWEMRELTVRLQSPDDAALKPLVTRLMQYYGPKIPKFEGLLNELLTAHGAELPKMLSETIVTSGSDSTSSASGLWTPGSTEQGAGEKKLWVPGQS